jgi:hypothetical protein
MLAAALMMLWSKLTQDACNRCLMWLSQAVAAATRCMQGRGRIQFILAVLQCVKGSVAHSAWSAMSLWVSGAVPPQIQGNREALPEMMKT